MAAIIFVFTVVFLRSFSSSFRILDTNVSCDQKNFLLTLTFEEPFHGIVYSERGFPKCVYVNASVLSQQYYAIKVPLDGCETTMNAEGNLENTVVVQEQITYSQLIDKKYLLTCIVTTTIPSALNNMATVNFGGITIENDITTTDIISARGLGQIPRYKVQLVRAGQNKPIDINTPLAVGDEISYIIRVPRVKSDARIGRCWAKDSASFLELSDDDGCSLQLKGNVWNQFERREEDGELIFQNDIKAWAFPTSNEVNIFCNLHVCRSICHITAACVTRQRRHPSSVNHNDDLVQETFSKLRISTVQREKREISLITAENEKQVENKGKLLKSTIGMSLCAVYAIVVLIVSINIILLFYHMK